MDSSDMEMERMRTIASLTNMPPSWTEVLHMCQGLSRQLKAVHPSPIDPKKSAHPIPLVKRHSSKQLQETQLRANHIASTTVRKPQSFLTMSVDDVSSSHSSDAGSMLSSQEDEVGKPSSCRPNVGIYEDADAFDGKESSEDGGSGKVGRHHDTPPMLPARLSDLQLVNSTNPYACVSTIDEACLHPLSPAYSHTASTASEASSLHVKPTSNTSDSKKASSRHAATKASDPLMDALKQFSWFVPTANSESAEAVLMGKRNGTFLIRFDDGPAQHDARALAEAPLVLSVVGPADDDDDEEDGKSGDQPHTAADQSEAGAKEVQHFDVRKTPDGQVYVFGNDYFLSVDEMVDYYRTHSRDFARHLWDDLSVPFSPLKRGAHTEFNA